MSLLKWRTHKSDFNEDQFGGLLAVIIHVFISYLLRIIFVLDQPPAAACAQRSVQSLCKENKHAVPLLWLILMKLLSNKDVSKRQSLNERKDRIPSPPRIRNRARIGQSGAAANKAQEKVLIDLASSSTDFQK